MLAVLVGVLIQWHSPGCWTLFKPYIVVVGGVIGTTLLAVGLPFTEPLALFPSSFMATLVVVWLWSLASSVQSLALAMVLVGPAVVLIGPAVVLIGLVVVLILPRGSRWPRRFHWPPRRFQDSRGRWPPCFLRRFRWRRVLRHLSPPPPSPLPPSPARGRGHRFYHRCS